MAALIYLMVSYMTFLSSLSYNLDSEMLLPIAFGPLALKKDFLIASSDEPMSKRIESANPF